MFSMCELRHLTFNPEGLIVVKFLFSRIELPFVAQLFVKTTGH